MKTAIKTALVIGATGYIGRHIVQQLIQQQIETYGLSRHGDPNAKGWRSFEGDLLNPEFPKLLSEIQPNVIFLATNTDRNHSLKEQLTTHVDNTRHLLRSLMDAQSGARIVILGSAAEYGLPDEPVDEKAACHPVNEYGVCKLAQTQVAQLYARRYNLPVVIGRVFNVYGHSPKTYSTASLASKIAKLERQKLQLPQVKVQNLNSWRDFIYVQDAATALVELGRQGLSGEIYNIGSGKSVSTGEVLNQLLSVSSLENPEVIAQGDQDETHSEAVITKIIQDTGWKPATSLADGLQRELEYWRNEAAVLTA